METPPNNYDLAPEYKRTNTKPDRLFSTPPTLLSLAGDLKGKTVLDFGCGGGFFANAFARRGAEHIIGIDNSSEQIALAKAQKD